MTKPYDALRMALISCRERFKSMIEQRDKFHTDAYAEFALDQAIAGFQEVEGILENPNNSEG